MLVFFGRDEEERERKRFEGRGETGEELKKIKMQMKKIKEENQEGWNPETRGREIDKKEGMAAAAQGNNGLNKNARAHARAAWGREKAEDSCK